MRDIKTVIHIGFPKTATSTLQEVYFPKAPSIHYLPAAFDTSSSRVDVNALQATFDMLHLDDVEYDPETVRQAFTSFLQRVDRNTHRVVLISQERFAAPMATNWRGDRGVIAKRIKDVFPSAKIVIVLRNQKSMIHSQYVNRNAKKANYTPLDEWLSFFFGNEQSGFAHEFRYDRLVDYYRETFGAENVHVALFEEFVADKGEFFRGLADFMGIEPGEFIVDDGTHYDANPTKSTRSFHYARFRNWFLPNVPLSRLMPSVVADAVRRYMRAGARARVEFSPSWAAQIVEYYAPGNARLASLIGEERLRRHGYPLAAHPKTTR